MLASGDGFGCTPLKEKSIADAFFNTQDNVGAVHAHIKKGSKVACSVFFFSMFIFQFSRAKNQTFNLAFTSGLVKQFLCRKVTCL